MGRLTRHIGLPTLARGPRRYQEQTLVRLRTEGIPSLISLGPAVAENPLPGKAGDVYLIALVASQEKQVRGAFVPHVETHMVRVNDEAAHAGHI